MRYVFENSVANSRRFKDLRVPFSPEEDLYTPKEQGCCQVDREGPFVEGMNYHRLTPRVHQRVEYVPSSVVRTIQRLRRFVLRSVKVTVYSVTSQKHRIGQG